MRLQNSELSDAEKGGLNQMSRCVPFQPSDHSRLSLSKSFYTGSGMPKVGTPERCETRRKKGAPLYSPEERQRRDASPWTIVQGILAPLQFLAFAVSLCLVVRYLLTNEGLTAATISVLIKTLFLFSIMVTGAIWEKAVFGRYLFAPAFFWEDVFSMLVIALHTAYCIALFGGYGSDHQQMVIALAAYGAYAINATQFLLKLRAARLDHSRTKIQSNANLELAQ